MVEVPLAWKLSVSGAEDVKSKLQDIKSQFDRGEISSTQYAKGLREVNRDARTLTRQSDIQKNVFLASHPALNSLSRGLSAFNSVAHSALAITNALNLIWIRQKGDTTELAIASHDLAQAQRDYNKAVTSGDMVKAGEAMERIRIAEAKIKEIKDPFKAFSDGVTIFSAVAISANSVIQIMPKVITAIKGSTLAMAALNAVSLPLLGTVGLFVATFTAAFLAGQELGKWLWDFAINFDYIFNYTIMPTLDMFLAFFGNIITGIKTAWEGLWKIDIPKNII